MNPPVVNSWNEWDPLEEVIVGIVDGAVFPSWNTINQATVPPGHWPEIEALIGQGGRPYPEEMVDAARECLDELVGILHQAHVIVTRPEPMNFEQCFGTPSWGARTGFCAANPRDVFLTIGDEIIEAPMPDRGRQYETWPYRTLMREYFRRGARWTSAPKPQCLDALYDADYEATPKGHTPIRWVTTEFEPAFDAADFVRCGRDLFVTRSHVTNQMGIEWLRRHLGPQFRIHEVRTRSPQAMHIDTTFMPLAPGKLLVNPEYIDVNDLPDAVKNWDILVAPKPVITDDNPVGVVSGWVNMNVIMLDPTHVVVEKNQTPMIKAFESWGFEPVPCAFEPYYAFAGSFHYATLDVRRRGALESYCDA